MPSDTRHPRHAGSETFYAAAEDETARAPGRRVAAGKGSSFFGRLIASVASRGEGPEIVIEPLPAPRRLETGPPGDGDRRGGGDLPDVRYVRTPSGATDRLEEPPAKAQAGDADEPRPDPVPDPVQTAAVDEIPTWRKPFTLPPNVRFTRTPDRALRSRPAEPEPEPPCAQEAEAEAEMVAPAPSPPAEVSEVPPPSPIPLSYLPDEAFWYAFANVAGIAEVSAAEDASLGPAALATPALPPPAEIEPAAAGRKRARSISKPKPDEKPRERRRIVIHLPDAGLDEEETEEPPPGCDDDAAVPGVSEADESADEVFSAEPTAPEPPRSRRVIDRRRPSQEPRVFARAPSLPAIPDYELPPVELLAEPLQQPDTFISPEALESNARLLEGVLEDFGIRGEIIHVRPGPVVTLYELEPAPGIKSSRVIGLADDIARSMSALSARVAVVPGRNVIGIELPNVKRETVYFRELIGSEDFEKSKFKLALCLGKTIGGEPVIAELAKMPHLLVAGTTGSGKSVAINTMILSLLYRLKPEECRLIMVDPKMLELSVYDGIPHLLAPVVTDPKKAVMALKWAVREMEERYKKMSKLGVRNIDGYNARAAEAKAAGEIVLRTVQTGFDKESGEALYEQEEMDLAPLPYIVVIVDEMADLMMVAGKDIEGAIQRLAQMARAAGIHLIMATQRPSVDVITGTIKANFPTRISFQVTSKIDSRTILGEQGAEQLLGQGDMLHMAGGGRISRVHGPFVSDDEVEKVVAHLKAQGRPDYLDAVTAGEDGEEGGAEDADGEAEGGAVFDKGAFGEDGADLYDQAVKVVLRDKKCSTSYIQRRLQIGYNRAASLVERMEKEGLVGPANHAGKREIIASAKQVREEEVEYGFDEEEE
jgi:S-DNA-T family DNA segregation ATPase FtsK/SpoIIIE